MGILESIDLLVVLLSSICDGFSGYDNSKDLLLIGVRV